MKCREVEAVLLQAEADGIGAGPGIEGEVLDMEGNEEIVQITIDSGAVDTVGPKKVGEGFPITPTKESIMGI